MVGRVKCPATGETVCINPVGFVGCSFDAVFTIALDNLLSLVGDVLETLSAEELSFLVDFADDMFWTMFNAFKTCAAGLPDKVPACNELNTLKACVSAVTTMVGSGPDKVALKKLAGVEAKAVTKALGKMELLSPQINIECGNGCSEGDCAKPTLVYKVPSNCTCTEIFNTLQNDYGTTIYGGMTPNTCSFNVPMYPNIASLSE